MSIAIDTKGIPPGAVRDRQISNQAKIDPAKLKPVESAQILVGQTTKKLSPQSISGDATLAPDGTLTLDPALVEGQVTNVLQKLNIEAGAQANQSSSAIKRLYEEIPGVNKFENKFKRDLQNAGSDNNVGTLMKRDVDGSVAVNVDRFTAGTSTSATVGTQTTATQGHPNTKVVAIISGTDGTGPNPATSATVPHNLGFIPSVSVVTVDGSTITPIETEVANGVNSTTVTLTQTIGSLDGNPDLKIILG